MHNESRLGANYLGNGLTSFRVWAPATSRARVVLASRKGAIDLAPEGDGYFHALAENMRPGERYMFQLDGGEAYPDPASKFQPIDVHSASEVVDSAFNWEDSQWAGHPLQEFIIYELHVGTFTPEGTFDAIIPELPRLVDLGITAIELMPVAQFPGDRNWGYDGVYPFAPQNSYGGPAGLKRLVNACHQHGLAVILDVVYNHLGPEGNYLAAFGPYFTRCYKTGWGDALNFDAGHSDQVRRFFIENALYWQGDFHIDALRLDAVHAIRDFSATPFLQDLARATAAASKQTHRPFYLIAESDLNDRRVISPEEGNGWGIHSQWSDDFHHCLHVLLTGERTGYYQDFGGANMLAKVYREGYAFTGQYSNFRRKRHGNSPAKNGYAQFVVCSQNHDQIGNRMSGERLSQLVSFESLKVAAAAVILSPFVPLLFMGEEYGEKAPFLYFTSHTQPSLVEAVRAGRAEEFASFKWLGTVPDPQEEATFAKSKIHLPLPESDHESRLLLNYYRELIRLRKSQPAIHAADRRGVEVFAVEHPPVVLVRYYREGSELLLLLSFTESPERSNLLFPKGRWRKLLDSQDELWGGNVPKGSGELLSNGRLDMSIVLRNAVLFERVA